MLDPTFELALQSAQPLQELRSLAKALLAKGQDQAGVLATFEQARQALREAKREKDEDVVMEVMDFLVGWCSPHMKLVPDQAAPGVTNPSKR